MTKQAPLIAELPDWLPEDAWNGYIDMRKSIKKKPTDRAVQIVQTKLLKMHQAGQDVAAVLDQSTLNNWTDVYPLREEKKAISGPWYMSDQSIIAKGGEMNMHPYPGEQMNSFKGRVQAAIDNGARPPLQQRVSRVGIAQEPRRIRPEGIPELKSLIKH